ncbi:hypothetical protein E1301_Tti006944 [Triplophysa tibetana]|uniref:C2H2-type domain-containing protein n=1 Tax=Triplophysa tibetana TaxID=1572043 RepID=A0A5A9N2P1_9TELE|nr:hypothetical protein E1301_Tti006944 [Triplophysa tibetana]
MTEYYEEGGLLYEHSPPMHIKVESPEGPFGGGVSEDGYPREDDDSDGSCDQQNGGLPGGLPFNVVVVHPNIVAPGMSSDELIPIDQRGVGKRKSRFSGAELEVLVSEVTRCEGELFGPAGRLRRRERERIWAGILERVNAVSRVPRTLREVKKRWDDLKRRNGGRLADARHRTCYLPPSRGAPILGRSSQLSPRLQHSRQKQSTRGKASFTCLSDTDPVTVGDGSERDGFEKEEEAGEQDCDDGDGDCEGVDNSIEDKLGLGLGLGIVPPPTSERWLPPSPLYSAPFLNGTPQPSPQPSLGTHQGPLEPPPPHSSWLEDELRGLGEAAMQLGDRMEQNLRDKVEQQPASDADVDRNVEVCAQGSSVKETADADVPSSPANENSPPHGATLSPSNKDASEMPCNSTATVDEEKINEDLQSKNGELVSTEPGEDREDTSGDLHNKNRGQDTNKEIQENAPETSSKDTIKETKNIHEKTESNCDGTQEERDEALDPDSMAKDKHKTEEGEDVSQNAGTTIKLKKSRLVCKECGKKFTRRETYNLHRHFHMHQDEEASLACKECGVTFQHRSDLIKHRSTHKEDTKPTFVSKVRKRRRSSHKIYERKFMCEHCGMCFSTMVRLHLHACKHNVEKPFRCPLCRKEFQYRMSINAHMQSHSLDSPYRCLECNKGFQSVESMHIHQRSHPALKPYECPDCNMVFRHRSVMEDHRRRHAEEKPHQCKTCRKNFKYSSLLQQHKFPTEYTLQSHMETHQTNVLGVNTSHITNLANAAPEKRDPVNTDAADGPSERALVDQTEKKPFRCKDCGKCFRYRSVLELHMRVHNKGYQCPVCKKSFRFSSYLQQHSIIHTGKKPYKCPDCGKDFAFHHNMRTHQRLHQQKPFRCTQCRKGLLVHQKIHTRKRQGQGHGYPLSIHSSRGRVKEFVSTGRRGRPRLVRDYGRTVSLRQGTLSGHVVQARMLPNVVPQQFDADGRERMQLGSQHLQTDNCSQTVQMQQEWPLQIPLPEELLHSQKSLLEAKTTNVEMQWPGSQIKISGNDPSPWVNIPNSSQPKTSPESQRPSSLDRKTKSPRSSQSPSKQLLNIQDPQQSQWSAHCDSALASKPEQFNNSTQDGKGTIDFDQPTSNESDPTRVRKEDLQNQKSPAKAEMGQTGGIMLSTGAATLQNTNPWGPKTSFDMSTTPPTWVGAGPSNQMGPINLPYTTARFPLGDRPPIWGFQNGPVVSQALLNGPVQQGHMCLPQHIALISGQQIPLNQPSSFISSPFPPPALNISAPLPMLSVGSQLPGPLPQGIFFSSQGTINEMPLIPQVTNLHQFAQQTEPHKIGNKMPFPPDQLFQCMICGCSLPGDLELQMHYMQHAQRDV